MGNGILSTQVGLVHLDLATISAAARWFRNIG